MRCIVFLGLDCFLVVYFLCFFLVCFVDGILFVDMEVSELFLDTFEVFSLKEIKFLVMRFKVDRDFIMEEDDMVLVNVVM